VAKNDTKGTKAAAPEKTRKKRRIRTAVFTRSMKIGFLRRFYIRRLLRYIEKSKKKGRALPADLVPVQKMLARYPRNKKKQMEVLEAALLAKPDENYNRQLRRMAGKQDRLRGSGYGNRPGAIRTNDVRPPKGPATGR
jgi:hypothetical protein